MRMLFGSLAFTAIILLLLTSIYVLANNKPRNVENCASKLYLESKDDAYTRLDALEECKNIL